MEKSDNSVLIDSRQRRPETPRFNENLAPFFRYCDGCGKAMYADDYTETLDCLGLCDDCYLGDNEDYE